ncbi:MAG: hypothetical protein JJE30_00580 [Desulfuromonadales bacterium]|nr:hypothetical protein [Desulfuromonadales bacterium]
MPIQLFPDIPAWWHACGATLAIVLFLLNRRACSANIVIVCITQLPGVVLHETTHLLAGVLFRAAPYSFSLRPERNRVDGGWILGSVVFGRVTAFNAVPIALAPLSLLPLAYCVYRYWFDWLSPTLPNTLVLYAVVFILIYNALPSRQDIRVACNWKSLLLYGTVTAVCGFFLGRMFKGI